MFCTDHIFNTSTNKKVFPTQTSKMSDTQQQQQQPAAPSDKAIAQAVEEMKEIFGVARGYRDYSDTATLRESDMLTFSGASHADPELEEAKGEAEVQDQDQEDVIDDDDEEEEGGRKPLVTNKDGQITLNVKRKGAVGDGTGSNLSFSERMGDIIRQHGFVLVRPAEVERPKCVTEHMNHFGAQDTELPYATNFPSAPGTHAQCKDVFEIPALEVMGYMYNYVAQASFLPRNELVPAPGYFMEADESAKAGPDALADHQATVRYVSAKKAHTVGVMALNRMALQTIVAPVCEEDGTTPGEMLDNLTCFFRSMSRAAAEGASDEFSMDMSVGGRLTVPEEDIWATYELQPGDIILMLRNQPFRLVPREGAWPRVAVTTSIREQDEEEKKLEAEADAKPTGPLHGTDHRLDISRARARGGVFRKGRFGLDYPLRPGSAPGFHQTPVAEDDWASPGDDPVLCNITLDPEDAGDYKKWSSDIVTDPVTWGFYYHGGKLTPGKARMMQNGKARSQAVTQPLTKWGDLAYLSCMTRKLIADIESYNARAAAVQLPPYSEKKTESLQKALDTQLQASNVWKRVDTDKLATNLGKVEAGLQKLSKTLEEREAVAAEFAGVQEQLEGFRALISNFPESKRIAKQMEVLDNRWATLQKTPTKSKHDDYVKSADVMSSLLEAAEEKRLSGGKRKRKSKTAAAAEASGATAAAGDSPSGGGDGEEMQYPDPETWVPPPEVVDDQTVMSEALKAWKGFYKEKKEWLQAMKQANQAVKKVAVYERLLKTDLVKEAKQLSVAMRDKQPYDLSMGMHIVGRLVYWPHNPLKMKAEAEAANKRKEAHAASKVQECSRCYNDRLISLAEQQKHGFSARCMVCLSNLLLATANEAMKIVKVAKDTGIVSDVTRNAQQIKADEANPKVEEDEEPEERIERYFSYLADAVEKMDLLSLKVEETPAVNGRLSLAFKDFNTQYTLVQKYVSMFPKGEVGDVMTIALERAAVSEEDRGDEYSPDDEDDDGDDDEQDEDDNFAPCCGGLLLPNGRCADCGTYCGTGGGNSPAARGFADEDEREVEAAAPPAHKRARQSTGDLMDALVARIPEGPVRQSLLQLREPVVRLSTGQRVEDPSIEWALFLSNKREAHPDTADMVFSRMQGMRVDDPENSFSNQEACQKWAAATYHFKDSAQHPMFVANVFSMKRAAEEQEEQEEGDAPSPKRRR